MKPILIIGASISAAAMAAGFAVLADQAIPRDRTAASASAATAYPARERAALTEIIARELRLPAQPQHPAPDPGATARPTLHLLPAPDAPRAATAQGTRPVPKPQFPTSGAPLPRLAGDPPLPGLADLANSPDSIEVSRVHNLPLTGVYR